MSVGRESILRAANAGAKKTEKDVKTVKAAETAARRKTVKKSVVSTANAEQIETVFITGNKKESVNGPVYINEELPVYLL